MSPYKRGDSQMTGDRYVQKPVRTYTRSGRLSSVFKTGNAKQLEFEVARLSVLVEDLRLETDGLYAKSVPGLETLGERYRRLYFLRRSIATLVEFSFAVQQLELLEDFQAIRKLFDENQRRLWNRSIKYFRKNSKALNNARNNIGGHFGWEAAKEAIGRLSDSEVGSLEIQFYPNGRAGAIFRFAEGVIASAVVRSSPRGKDGASQTRRLFRIAKVGFNHSVTAIYCITAVYLWDRFGK